MLDQRLDRRDGAVVRSRVSPSFEEVSLRNVPLAGGRCFIEVASEVDCQVDLSESTDEVEIGGRVVGRVGAEHEERGHFAVRHLLGELA